VDLITYAELAVRLANTTANGEEKDGDSIATLDGLRALLADSQYLNARVTRSDLDAMRALRAEFRRVFAACAAGNGAEAVERLNALLVQHPVHPQISGHEGQPWHLHLTQGGSVADSYAAGAAMGLAIRLTSVGTDRFGICQATSCLGVFIDTSTNRSRRYCSDRCASRANVTAFRARQRAGTPDVVPSGVV
jgi:predicted RNA-binding Zn ribbon-like protein